MREIKSSKRRAVNLTIRTDLLVEAKTNNVNASRAAEAGIAAAVKTAKEEAWLRNNRAALDAHNERIRKHGLLIKPYWDED